MRRVAWLRAAAGVACVVLGVVLIVRPFTSLTVLIVLVVLGLVCTGAVALAGAWRSRRFDAAVGVGGLSLVAALTVIAWPGMTTRTLAVVVAVMLFVGGFGDAIHGLRGTRDERLAGLIGGSASIVFGVLAVSWPDVTVLVVAVVFGMRLVQLGLRVAWSAMRERSQGSTTVSATERPPPPVARLGHIAVAVMTLVIALGLAILSAELHDGEPLVDAFYNTPSEIPAEPGQLLRSEPFTRAVPPGARAWRILYTTTRNDGVPAVASGIVVVPDGPGPHPAIAWGHGTTGVDRTCAPSVLDDPFGAGAFFLLPQVIEQGWALIATDYVGLGTAGGHPYLVGQPAGRSVLDATRAANQLDDADIADETVVWGHSQGGGAALWAGVLTDTYAPELDIRGVAALAPASDVAGLVTSLNDVPGGSIFAAYAVDGYSLAYPDVHVDDYVRPAARTTFEETAARCLSEPAVLISALSSVTTGASMFRADFADGPLVTRLRENVPAGPISAPLLIAQGEADSLIVPSVQAAYVRARCDAGQAVDYRTYPVRDHVSLVQADSPLIPDLIDWTTARLAGDPPTPTCQ